ncbi:unnamed protein product [Citrullus colocynthis]|uniref:Uncharacterized protein n=1 Tax=Citrullus colocynthis TaxID=252529 RepID=A0ABP0YJ01_9ROSI
MRNNGRGRGRGRVRNWKVNRMDPPPHRAAPPYTGKARCGEGFSNGHPRGKDKWTAADNDLLRLPLPYLESRALLLLPISEAYLSRNLKEIGWNLTPNIAELGFLINGKYMQTLQFHLLIVSPYDNGLFQTVLGTQHSRLHQLKK